MRKPSPRVIPSRVVEARKAANHSQASLAAEVGMTQQAINAIENGEVARPTKLFDIAGVLSVDMDYLLGNQDAPVDPFKEDVRVDYPATTTVRIPDLAIFAGMGGGGMIEVDVDDRGRPIDADQVRGYWEIPEYMLARFGNLAHIRAWEVRGDSMEPTLSGGSVVFVDTSQTRLPPDDIYAVNYGDGLMVKRLKLVPRTDKVAVISDNERYGQDDLLRDDVKVWGRVIGWFQWRG